MPSGTIVNNNSGTHVHISALILLRLVKGLLIKTIFSVLLYFKILSTFIFFVYPA